MRIIPASTSDWRGSITSRRTTTSRFSSFRKPYRKKPGDSELTALVARIAERLQLWDQAIENSSIVLAQDPKRRHAFRARIGAARQGRQLGPGRNARKAFRPSRRLGFASGNRPPPRGSGQPGPRVKELAARPGPGPGRQERDPLDRTHPFLRKDFALAIESLLRTEYLSNPDLAAMLFVSYVQAGKIPEAESFLKTFFFGPERLTPSLQESAGQAFSELGKAMEAEGKMSAAAHYFQRSLIFRTDPEVKGGLKKLEAGYDGVPIFVFSGATCWRRPASPSLPCWFFSPRRRSRLSASRV